MANKLHWESLTPTWHRRSVAEVECGGYSPVDLVKTPFFGTGVKQGCILSPQLYLGVFDAKMKSSAVEHGWLCCYEAIGHAWHTKLY